MAQTPVMFVHNRRCGGNVINECAYDYHDKGQDLTDDGVLPIFKLGGFMEREHGWDDFLAEARRGRKRYYAGHFPFGAGRHVKGKVDYLTNVREPEARLTSLSKTWGNEAEVDDPDDWLRNNWEADNGMTRRLAGIGPLAGKAHDFVTGEDLCDEGAFKVTAEVFERAKANLQKGVAAIVVKERFVESLVLAEKKLGWPPMFSFAKVHFNPSPDIPVPADEGLIADIVAANDYDRALYAAAVAIFEAELKMADRETEDMIAARQAIDKMLHIPFLSVLEEDQVSDCINRGLNELITQGKKDVAIRVMTLFVGHPHPKEEFRQSLMAAVRQIGGKAEIEAVEYRYNYPYSF